MKDSAITLFLLVVIVFVLNSLVISLIWNTIIVQTIPGVGELNFFSAMGVYILANILFKDNPVKGLEK